MSWYALHVRSQSERRVHDFLLQRAIEPYLPLYRERRRWSDRDKDAEAVLFPGYVFASFDLVDKRQVISVPGVVRILGTGDRPAPVPDEEIEQVKLVIASGLAVTPVPYLAQGQRVRVERGSLTGVEGIVVRVKNELRVVVSVELLRRSVMAELDTDALAVVDSKRRTA